MFPKDRACCHLRDWFPFFWQLAYPFVSVLLSKKDISEAFKWLWLMLRDIHLFASDMPGKDFGIPYTITALYLVLTFGWSGSPGEWMVFAWLLKNTMRRGNPRGRRGTAPNTTHRFSLWMIKL